MDQRLLRLVWLSIFGAIMLVPSFGYLMVRGPVPQTLWERLAEITGLLSLSVLVCTAVLPSRMRSINKAFGIETVLNMHKFLGVTSASVVFLHIACVVAEDPANVALFNLATAPGRAKAATIATFCLIALALITVLRQRAKIGYELWKASHVTLAVSVLVFGAIHIWLLDQMVRQTLFVLLFTLILLFVLSVIAYRWAWRPLYDPSTEFVVREVRPEARSISTLVLEPKAKSPGQPPTTWAFAPGQFAWIRVGSSMLSEEHPFTIASSAHSETTDFTIRHAGDFTRTIQLLRPGTSVWVDGPHGDFSSDMTRSTGFVLLAAGVGITPMMSMIRTAAHRQDPRMFRLVYVVSSPEDILFRQELAEIRTLIDLEVTEVLRRPVPGWTGHTGDIGVDLLNVVLNGTHPDHCDYFVCGPPTMVKDTVETLDALGVAPRHVHTEQFDMA